MRSVRDCRSAGCTARARAPCSAPAGSGAACMFIGEAPERRRTPRGSRSSAGPASCSTRCWPPSASGAATYTSPTSSSAGRRATADPHRRRDHRLHRRISSARSRRSLPACWSRPAGWRPSLCCRRPGRSDIYAAARSGTEKTAFPVLVMYHPAYFPAQSPGEAQGVGRSGAAARSAPRPPPLSSASGERPRVRHRDGARRRLGPPAARARRAGRHRCRAGHAAAPAAGVGDGSDAPPPEPDRGDRGSPASRRALPGMGPGAAPNLRKPSFGGAVLRRDRAVLAQSRIVERRRLRPPGPALTGRCCTG